MNETMTEYLSEMMQRRKEDEVKAAQTKLEEELEEKEEVVEEEKIKEDEK